jgi:hypothetical protein
MAGGRFHPGGGRGRGGRGRGRGGCGGGGGASPGSDKDSQLLPFLQPAPRALVPVPLQFESVAHFCHLIGNNLLAEFWHLIQEGPRGPPIKAMPAADGKLTLVSETESGENLIHNLLLVNNQLHLVVAQTGGALNPATGERGSVLLSLKPRLSGFQGQIRSFGYVGSYVAELAALQELALAGERAASPVLRAVLDPSIDVLGHWHPPPLPEEDFVRGDEAKAPKANASQRAAVCALRNALEKIQGPPGTGKSTTIYHVITQRVPPGRRVLVTCSRNVAIESIAQKLEACDAEILVVGAPGRIGSTARKHLLDAKVESHPKVRAVAAASLGGFQSEAALDAAKSVRGDLMEKCQLVLCTIASTSRLLREWEEHVKQPLRVHTVVVDECGCTPESSTALLLNLRPQNLVLLGDHNQLPPCSLVPPQALKGTGHDRSTLERCVMASGGRVHRLTEQYRMHPRICEAVSRRFYQDQLDTAPATAEERRAHAEACGEPDAMVWVQVHGEESVPGDGKSYVNRAEVDAVVAAATRVRERHGPNATVAALTFYKGQYVALLEAMPASLKVECLTVDACQGSEFDHVLVSPVRANPRRAIGFVADGRRINVAVSRARRQCVILGDEKTMACRPGTDWHAIRGMCKRETYGVEGCRWKAPPPEAGFVSVWSQKRASAKEPAQSEEKKEDAAGGTNVGAAAFLPAAVLAAVAPPQTGKQAKKKKKKDKASKAAQKMEAARREHEARFSVFGGGTNAARMEPPRAAAPPPVKASNGMVMPRKLMMAAAAKAAPQMAPMPGPGPALGLGPGAAPGPVPGTGPAGPPPPRTPPPPFLGRLGHAQQRQQPPPPPRSVPPPLAGTYGAPRPGMFPLPGVPAPPLPSSPPPPFVGHQPHPSPPPVDDEDDWEPPTARLGSALNLREMDVLRRSDSFESPGWIGGAPGGEDGNGFGVAGAAGFGGFPAGVAPATNGGLPPFAFGGGGAGMPPPRG